jgi:hypothetical protein
MAFHLQQNVYRGVNAHLHSHYQAHGGWEGFHTQFISMLATSISPLLPAGYTVDMEQSLQLREFHPDTGEFFRRRFKPDVAVYERPYEALPLQKSPTGAVPTLTRSVAATLQPVPDEYLTAVVVYALEDNQMFGQPITQIEILSPSNKRGVGLEFYLAKREMALKSGLCLVEVDLLHETDPLFFEMPSYARQAVDAYPYNITISNPHPSLEEGLAMIFAFHVDMPLPELEVPLRGKDSFLFNFDAVYQDIYASLPAYSLRVDYAALPARFERYSLEDQERIRAVMARAAEASRE